MYAESSKKEDEKKHVTKEERRKITIISKEVDSTFICLMSSNICSGGKLATALVIASGASSGRTGWPCNGGCTNIWRFINRSV